MQSKNTPKSCSYVVFPPIFWEIFLTESSSTIRIASSSLFSSTLHLFTRILFRIQYSILAHTLPGENIPSFCHKSNSFQNIQHYLLISRLISSSNFYLYKLSTIKEEEKNGPSNGYFSHGKRTWMAIICHFGHLVSYEFVFSTLITTFKQQTEIKQQQKSDPKNYELTQMACVYLI